MIFSPFLKQTQGQIKAAILKHPLEILLISAFAIPLWFVDIDLNVDTNHLAYWLFMPILFAFVYLCRSYRCYKFSWVVPLVVVLAVYFVNDDANFYVDEPKYWGLLGMSLIIFCGFPFVKNNQAFTHGNFIHVLHIVLAGLVSGLIVLLSDLLFFSLEALFGVFLSRDFYAHFNLFVGFFFVPLFFLTFQQRQNPKLQLSAIWELVINWVASPVLMAFTLLFYAYVGKILLQSELPQGMVANIALPYLIGGVVIYALRAICEAPRWQAFFTAFPYFALVPLVLLGFAIERRVSDYAWTESRIYLLAFALAMLLIYGLLMLPKLRQYRWVSAVLMLAIFSMTWIINPQEIAYESQKTRFEQILKQLDLADENGKVRADLDVRTQVSNLSEAQRKSWEELSELVYYLIGNMPKPESVKDWYWDERNAAFVALYGEKVADFHRLRFYGEQIQLDSEALNSDEQHVFLMEETPTDISGFKTLYWLNDGLPTYRSQLQQQYVEGIPNLCWNNETFCVDVDKHIQAVFKAHGLDIKQHQNQEQLAALKPQLLVFETPDYKIYFQQLVIEFKENQGYQFVLIEGKGILVK